MIPSDKALVVFQGKKIRRTWFNDEWWFSVVDIVEALTQTDRARKYWSDLKIKLQDEGCEMSEKIGQLKLMADDGKLRLTDCATTKNMFRVIQSIPSPNAEPFKQWLAQVGYDRVQEIENPELAQQRMKGLYRAKGYSDDWIETGTVPPEQLPQKGIVWNYLLFQMFSGNYPLSSYNKSLIARFYRYKLP